MFKTLDQALIVVREHSVAQIDLKFCDLWGRWHHVTLPAACLDAELLAQGVGFDGSSVGFKSVSAGDMVLVPDLGTAFLDPFWERPTLSFICRTMEADTRRDFAGDPRSIALRAEAFLQQAGIADASLWGPELEFYVFDGVMFENGTNVAAYRVESAEAAWSSRQMGSGYTLPVHGGYHALPPRDHLNNLRSRMTAHLQDMDVPVKYHHHEVGGAGQCEIEIPMLPFLQAADATLLIKYVARQTALQAGMTATFLPKPLYGEAGSGMHFHQQLRRGETNLFYAADGYGTVSELARSYIAGLLYHGAAVMAFTNPSTNSYRRLVPGYEAPVSALYSLGNRSAAIRIPGYANQPETARFEFRPPDAMCNPYLAMAAQLMAGIDGILNRMDPTELGFGPIDDDVFAWSPERQAQIKALPTSLGAALDALASDHDFLLRGDVFPQSMIHDWIERKALEERQVRERPHPYEIEMYYDL